MYSGKPWGEGWISDANKTLPSKIVKNIRCFSSLICTPCWGTEENILAKIPYFFPHLFLISYSFSDICLFLPPPPPRVAIGQNIYPCYLRHMRSNNSLCHSFFFKLPEVESHINHIVTHSPHKQFTEWISKLRTSTNLIWFSVLLRTVASLDVRCTFRFCDMIKTNIPYRLHNWLHFCLRTKISVDQLFYFRPNFSKFQPKFLFWPSFFGPTKLNFD